MTNTTGDAVFDDTLRLALAVSVEQAPFLRVLSREEVRAGLVRMDRPADERMAGPVAHAVCQREGASVLLAGSIAPLGSRYAVGVEAVACETGESIAHVIEEADRKEFVLTALSRAAAAIRGKLGESRGALLHDGVPLVRTLRGQVGRNVLNLLDQKGVTDVWRPATPQVLPIPLETFFAGFDAEARIDALHILRDARFLQPNAWQPARDVRVSFKLMF